MPTSDDDVEDFYEVEAVVGQRKKKGRKEYLIKWKGYASDQNTWEPIANLNKSAREEARAYNKGESPSKRPRLDSSGSSGSANHDDIVVKKEQSSLPEEKKKIALDADTPGKEHTADDDSPTNQNGKDDGATKVASAAAIKREFQTDTDDESPPATDKLDSQVKLKREYLADTDDDDDGGPDDDEFGNKEQLTTHNNKSLDTPEGAEQLKEAIDRVISENADDVDDFGSIETLVSSGASIDAIYGIHVALDTQLLLDAKFKDANRWVHTPRKHLPQSSFNKLLRKLIELGGDVQLADERGEQPLHLAAVFPYHNIDSIKILIEAGADVSAKDGEGNTVVERIRAESHEVGDDDTNGFIFIQVWEDDVIPPYEALSALMTNEQKQKHVDGWLSPRMKFVLLHVARSQIDDMVDNPSLGLSNTLRHIPPEVLRKYNSKNGHWSGYFECAKEFQLIFVTISSLLESGMSPTVDRVRTRLNGVPDYLNFTRNGGRVEHALDYILYQAKYEGDDCVYDYQSEYESLDPSSLDGMYEMARFMLVNRGGGETTSRGPYEETRGIMGRVQGYWNY
mmetsp:Transcript_7970/g.13474  ORF Transcript_7970/g.13474 Transcript_7970/m.13474 type:complete len:567 (-) Transcript_7970:353-2053(-)